MQSKFFFSLIKENRAGEKWCIITWVVVPVELYNCSKRGYWSILIWIYTSRFYIIWGKGRHSVLNNKKKIKYISLSRSRIFQCYWHVDAYHYRAFMSRKFDTAGAQLSIDIRHIYFSFITFSLNEDTTLRKRMWVYNYYGWRCSGRGRFI